MTSRSNGVLSSELGPDEHNDFEVHEASFCIDYLDEYVVTLTFFGPNLNKVRQYLRERFVYTLAEVMALQTPLVLLSSADRDEADLLRVELQRLDAGIRVVSEPGPRKDQIYPKLRVPLFRKI